MSNKRTRDKPHMKPEREERLSLVAERSYENAMRQWEADLESAEEVARERMQDPAYLARRGLPPIMPQASIGILAKAQAMDAIGPRKPDRKKFYSAQGVYRDVGPPR